MQHRGHRLRRVHLCRQRDRQLRRRVHRMRRAVRHGDTLQLNLHGDRPVRVAVRVGVSDGSISEVVEGELSEGDEVITDASGGKTGGGPPGGGQPFRRGF